MEIINGIQSLDPNKKLILTIGMFDGVHKGHQAIINKLNQYAAQIGGHSALLSFNPHPRFVLQPDCDLELLTTLDEKLSLLEAFGLDYAIIHPFNKEFSRLTAVEYVRDYLVNQLHIHTLLVGHDHHFGRNRTGDFNQLQELAELYDFNALQLCAVLEGEKPISSTKIRIALKSHDISYATEALGHYYTITGKVVHGNKIGRELKYPTINLAFSKDKLLPAHGVYGVRVKHKEECYFGLMNIGKRPTFEFNELRVEIFLLDYSGDLYNECVRAEIVSFIREEKKFDSLGELKQQIQKDEAYFRSEIKKFQN